MWGPGKDGSGQERESSRGCQWPTQQCGCCYWWGSGVVPIAVYSGALTGFSPIGTGLSSETPVSVLVHLRLDILLISNKSFGFCLFL